MSTNTQGLIKLSRWMKPGNQTTSPIRPYFKSTKGGLNRGVLLYIPCTIQELSDTIPESTGKLGIPTLRRTILKLFRFLQTAAAFDYQGDNLTNKSQLVEGFTKLIRTLQASWNLGS